MKSLTNFANNTLFLDSREWGGVIDFHPGLEVNAGVHWLAVVLPAAGTPGNKCLVGIYRAKKWSKKPGRLIQSFSGYVGEDKRIHLTEETTSPKPVK